jgi:hypothetical protein
LSQTKDHALLKIHYYASDSPTALREWQGEQRTLEDGPDPIALFTILVAVGTIHETLYTRIKRRLPVLQHAITQQCSAHKGTGWQAPDEICNSSGNFRVDGPDINEM